MSFRMPKRRVSATLQLDGSSKMQANRRVSVPSLEPLEHMVICPIHLNLLDDPRLLPCGHAFCCDCLTYYMRQLLSTTTATNTIMHGLANPITFACPICRTPCPVPADGNAQSLPKAFNHIVILDFLRKNCLSQYRVQPSVQPSAPPDMNEDGTDKVTVGRKTSIQVNSEMLNYIVSDIATRERDGKINDTDRAVILDDVEKLLERLQIHDSETREAHAEKAIHPNVNNKAGSTTPSTASPTGSHRNLGRFHTFASRVRHARRRSTDTPVTEQSDYTPYEVFRDVENERLHMKQNCIYRKLPRSKAQAGLWGEKFQPVDMQLLRTNQITQTDQVIRCILTTTDDHSELILYRQSITVGSQSMLSWPGRSRKKHAGTMLKSNGPLKLDGYSVIQVHYVRFHGGHILLTATVRMKNDKNKPNQIDQTSTQEFGMLIRCTIAVLDDLNMTDSSDGLRSNDPFPVETTSCLFERDVVGLEHAEWPILFGFDIDRTTGDVYLAQPANAILCRIKANDWTQVDKVWCLEGPQLSPHFLCFARNSNQIWATSPLDGKMVILHMETGVFQHFNATNSFGINPSHIIHTADDQTVLLDQTQSRMFLISIVHQTICIQRLNVHLSTNKKRQLLAIQPVDDPVQRAPTKNLKSYGGILCVQDQGCVAIYPKKNNENTGCMPVLFG